VLRDDGLLIFTYHHSRPEGWRCVLHALAGAGFVIVAVHPIKAEMSVAALKSQAKEPIDYDVIMVCRKTQNRGAILPRRFGSVLKEATTDAVAQEVRLRACNRPISRNDVRIVLMAQVLRQLSNQPVTSPDPIKEHEAELETAIDAVYVSGTHADFPAERPEVRGGKNGNRRKRLKGTDASPSPGRRRALDN
jgi:adenine-specific DNA methylase